MGFLQINIDGLNEPVTEDAVKHETEAELREVRS